MRLSEIMLTRVLERNGREVRVEFGQPVPFGQGELGCYLRFRITGLDAAIGVIEAQGLDGVQALQFAMTIAGDLLASEGVTHMGMEGSGFPTTVAEEGAFVSTLRLPADPSLLEA